MSRRRDLGGEHRPPWWEEKNRRAMVICRISDKKQKDGVSLDMQAHHASEYAVRAGLEVARVRPFTETAKKSELRVQFHAAIEEARRRDIRHLVFYVWDRVSRNFTDAEMLEEMIRDREIIVHIATGGTVLHADSDDSEFFLFDITIAQAKQDNRGRRRKTIDGMEERCRAGWSPGKLPWFYWHEPAVDEEGRRKKRGGTVAGPTAEGRRLLRREMELHLGGYSLDRVRETCLAEGLVPAKHVARYHRSVIDKHLKNVFFAALPVPRPDPERPHEVFKSRFTWRGKVYDGKHEPVFTADEWTRLEASFGTRSTYRKLKHEGLFSHGPLTLACADAACGCKITYAPKQKAPNATVYKFYRCADGKRIHRERGEPQINVREDSILQQLGAALDQIEISAKLAAVIADALNETHRAASAAKARSAAAYRAQIVELDSKEDRLFDRFDAGDLDRDAYNRQLSRLRVEKNECFDKLRQTDAATDTTYLVTAQRVLELATKAKSLWEVRDDAEKRDLLARVVCNPRLDGRTVRYDLQKHFAALAQMRGEEGWRPQGDSNPC